MQSTALSKVKNHLLYYFPSVLTTIIIDYCEPGYEIIPTSDWQPSNQILNMIPPIDAIWRRNGNYVNFYHSDGTAIGSLSPSNINKLVDIVITETRFYIVYFGGSSYLDRNLYTITAATDFDGVIKYFERGGLHLTADHIFQSDGDAFVYISEGHCGRYTCLGNHYLMDQWTYDELHIIDIIKIGRQYFIAGTRDNKAMVDVCLRQRDDFTFVYAFQLAQCPLLISGDTSKIITLSAGKYRSTT